jgi:hypothetical protein
MAYISFQPSDYFNTKLYTGTGSSNALTGVGFQPDMVWVKGRDYAYNHVVSDSVRGEKQIYPNLTNAQDSNTGEITSFDSDGFTVGTGGDVNYNTRTFAAWNWKAGTTTGLSGGTLTPSSYSFNATSGFGIYAYTGTGSAATIPHGLGVAPEVVMVKRLDSTSAWSMYWKVLGANKYIYLNSDSGPATDSTSEFWNNTDPTSTVFSVKDAAYTNGSTNTYIAYCWASVKGHSKFSSYVGNGNADGPMIYTGFRPAFVLIKYNGTNQWQLVDNKRGYNGDIETIYPDAAEVESGGNSMDLLSNGFKIRVSSANRNQNGVAYYYAAFAKFPFVSSNSIPTVAR